MVKILFIPLLVISLFANDEYLPLSEISKNKKIEYNFITNNKIENRYNDYKSVDIMSKKKFTNRKAYKKITNERKKPRVYKQKIVKRDIEKKNLILQDTKNEMDYKNDFATNINGKNISVIAQLTYESVSSKLDNKKFDSSNTYLPKLYVNINEHTIIGEYFKNSNSINFNDIDVLIYTLGYRYNMQINKKFKISLGLDQEYLNLDNSNDKSDYSEYFPNLAFDLDYNILDIFNLSYGNSIGANGGDIKYAYKYYLNIETSPNLFNNRIAFMTGYKHRTIKFKETNKLELFGPYVGLKVFF